MRLKVDVIVTGGAGATLPAKKATATIPIVMAQDSDPVGSGFVASLARPGGEHNWTVNASPGDKRETTGDSEGGPRLLRVAVFGTSTWGATHRC